MRSSALQNNRPEFKKRGQRRRRQRWLKDELIFYLRISRYSKLILFVSRRKNYQETEHGTQR